MNVDLNNSTRTFRNSFASFYFNYFLLLFWVKIELHFLSKLSYNFFPVMQFNYRQKKSVFLNILEIDNFINVKRTNFLYERRFSSFFYVRVTRKSRRNDKFETKNLYVKTLMKLTHASHNFLPHYCWNFVNRQHRMQCCYSYSYRCCCEVINYSTFVKGFPETHSKKTFAKMSTSEVLRIRLNVYGWSLDRKKLDILQIFAFLRRM
jgi:hypothetical protein